jgi:FkbM family methyltransferase
MKRFAMTQIQKALGLAGYSLVNHRVIHRQARNPLTRNHFLDLYFQHIDPSEFFFIQVGANDGKSGDPIHPHVVSRRLRGILLEPQPDVFELLKKHYEGCDRVILVNAALSHETGTATLYTVRESFKNQDNFFPVTGIASFNREVFLKTLRGKLPRGANPADYLQKTEVECTDFPSLFAKHGVNRVDLLQIDCEGYDFEILKMFDFERFQPSIVNYESVHLSNQDCSACEALLLSHGCKLFNYRGDTCAYR